MGNCYRVVLALLLPVMMSSTFSSNSEAKASELLENVEEMLLVLVIRRKMIQMSS